MNVQTMCKSLFHQNPSFNSLWVLSPEETNSNSFHSSSMFEAGVELVAWEVVVSRIDGCGFEIKSEITYMVHQRYDCKLKEPVAVEGKVEAE